MPRNIPISQLLKAIEYDPETGLLTNMHTGNTIGYRSRNNLGHMDVEVNIFGSKYRAHRVAWAIQTGGWPLELIDHINGDSTDNRWHNLREVNPSESMKNLAMQARNTTGIAGVFYRKTRKKWVAFIGARGRRQIYYGDDFFEACCRRISAENRLGYHANHCRRRPI